MKRQFKALIFDLDGTAIAQKEEALPSQRLIKAVSDANQVLKVSAATGRPITNCRGILKLLNLTSPCVISGGSQIIDPITEEVIWEKRLEENQVRRIVEVCVKTACKMLFSDELLSDNLPMKPNDKKVDSSERVVYIMELSEEDVPNLVEKLNLIPEIAVHPVPSWQKDKKDIHITHKLATKQHALEKLVDILGIDQSQVVSVGDSGNDIPLFRVSGYKVAMGNATEELKESADLVIRTVDEDGLAQFIEEKLLRKKPFNVSN